MKSNISKQAGVAVLLCGAVGLSGCSTTRTFVDYSKASLYSTETVGNVPYVEIGPATASQRGFFWNSCAELSEKAVVKLRDVAEERGANNVIAVRWLNHADGSYTETPICTTGWGWFTAGVFPGFGPWVKVTELQGRLVHADESTLTRLKQGRSQFAAGYQQRKAEALAQAEAAKAAAEQAERDAERMAKEKEAAEEAAEEAEKARLKAEKAEAKRLAAEKEAAEEAEEERLERQKEAEEAAAKQAAQSAQ